MSPTFNSSEKDAEIKQLKKLLTESQAHLEFAQETLDAIRNGTVDGIVRSTPQGNQIFILKGSDEPYRILIEEMNEAAVLLSGDNSILYSNAGFAKLVDAKLEKIVGTHIQDWISVSDKDKIIEIISEIRKGPTQKKMHDITFKTSKRQVVPTQLSIYNISMGSVDVLGLIATNLSEHMDAETKRYTANLEKEVTRRRKAEEALLTAKEAVELERRRLETVLENIPMGVVIADAQTFRFSTINKRARELYGFDSCGLSLEENVIKVKPKKLDGSPYPIEELPIYLAMHGTVTKNKELLLERPNGTNYPIFGSAAPIVGKKGEIIAAVVLFEDITERKQAEEKLRKRTAELQETQRKLEESATRLEEYANQMEQLAEERLEKLRDSERLATIGQVAGMVGHDIRNPLQAIIGATYLAEADIEILPPSAEKTSALEGLKEVQTNVDYINKIVADLQDYSRVLKPNIKETNLEKLCTEALGKNVPERIEATCRIGDKVKVILSDAALLQRILYNLISNAVRAMPTGGELIVEAKQEGEDVVITVQDTGVGIPDEIKPKLFTPLFTTSAKGQGFGLVVIKRMTEALGGTVTFESKVGRGTKFTVRFPFSW